MRALSEAGALQDGIVGSLGLSIISLPEVYTFVTFRLFNK
jgi:hypothetical protein